MKTFVRFKCNIEMDLKFYVRVGTCEKRITGSQPLARFVNITQVFQQILLYNKKKFAIERDFLRDRANLCGI